MVTVTEYPAALPHIGRRVPRLGDLLRVQADAPVQSLVPHLLRAQQEHPGENFAARKHGGAYTLYALTPHGVRGVCEESAWRGVPQPGAHQPGAHPVPAARDCHDAVVDAVAGHLGALPHLARDDAHVFSLAVAEAVGGALGGGGWGAVAATLTLALHHLGEDPVVQERVAAVLPVGRLRYEAVATLSRVRAVVDETTRLWPVVPLLLRQAARDTVTAGHRFHGGEVVVVLPQLMGRTPELFGATADEFAPARFADPHQRRAMALFVRPFGVGARECPGRELAVHVLAVAVAAVVTRYRLVATGDLRVQEVPSVWPTGVRLRVEVR